jgi:hypothetical protein|tara:strand:- start:371 stop:619 length:249 start_codon:yes stop_codon:yes gene_type:complete
MSDESKKNSQEYAIDFIKAFADTEAEILPYREHLKDLKTSYVENGWLTKQELRMAVKAYRMLKSDEDIEQLTSFYEKISRSV